MEKRLLQKLSQITKEEQAILDGKPLNFKQYAPGESSVITEKRMLEGKGAIAIRPHPRFTSFPTHSHNFIEIMTVISGSITHFIGENYVKLEKGDILLMNKHTSHSIERAEACDIGINFIVSDAFIGAIAPSLSDTFFSDFIKENAKSAGSAVYLHFRTEGVKKLENLMENLLFELTEPNESYSFTEKTLSLLLEHLSVMQRELLIGESAFRSKEEERKSKILSYIKSSYASATLSDLSTRIYLSVPHLSKKISDYFGKSFKELLTEERMRRAAELLLKSDMPIGLVIRSVGYESESYFHREFKKRWDTTPLNMRKSRNLTRI